MKIPLKHKKFADQYFLTGKMGLSYQDVYKCTKNAAAVGANKLLKDPNIQKYINELRLKSTEKTLDKWVANANDILHEDSLLATHRVPGILDENGMLKDIHDWPDDMQAAIKTIEYDDVEVIESETEDGPVMKTERRIKKIHFNDKGQALGRMERALGIISDEGGDTNIFDIRVILAKIDGLNRGKLPQDCD
jgi:hypothetical protein